MKLFLLFLMGAFICGVSANERREWAFYGYFVGDEKDSASLETSQVRDLIELKNGSTSNNSWLIVQHDRGTKLSNTLSNFYQDKNYSGVARYRMDSEGVYILDKIGEKNMGDAQTFFDFLDWSMKNYPADKVVIGVNAHGSGILSWSGPTSYRDDLDYDDVHILDNQFVGYDATGDNLTIFEFRKALEVVSAKYPDSSIEIVLFDACYSSMSEVLTDLKHVTKVVIASSSTIPGTGMDYSAISQSMSFYDCDTVRLSKAITKAFIHSTNGDNILSAWNMGKVSELEAALNHLVQLMILAMKQGEKRGFRNLLNYSDNYWDLSVLCDSLIDGNSDMSVYSDVRQAASAVKSALEAARLSCWTDGKFSSAHAGGLSLFWPSKEDYLNYGKFYKKLQFSRDNIWDEFLDFFLLGKSPRQQIFNELYSN
jgi:hypothetical protein